MPYSIFAGRNPVRSFHITAVPAGEAPLWVREKWVGVTLPLAHPSPRHFRIFGVLSGPRTWIGIIGAWLAGKLQQQTGYAVESRVAIELLEMSSPEAAAWWKENTPHFLQPRRYFVFREY